MSGYALKLGDDDPALEFLCVGVDGEPADLSGIDAIQVGVRRSGETEYALLRDAEVVDAPAGHARVVWEIGDSEELGVGDMEFEVQVTRTGNRVTTFPSEGYGTFTIWQDIVPDAGS